MLFFQFARVEDGALVDDPIHHLDVLLVDALELLLLGDVVQAFWPFSSRFGLVFALMADRAPLAFGNVEQLVEEDLILLLDVGDLLVLHELVAFEFVVKNAEFQKFSILVNDVQGVDLPCANQLFLVNLVIAA